MTLQKLKEILDKHSKWMNGEDGGECANFCGVDLHGADLSYADLSYAELHGADLSGANLFDAKLRSASLNGADLSGANLRGADLRYVDLKEANLHGADLSGANLRSADLCFTNLHSANLCGADLRSADLGHTDLTQAACSGTVLNLQCPEEGSFIAWKKLAGDSIAKLLIPEDAKRSSGTTRKCRASKAVVLAIYNRNGEETSKNRSRYDFEFLYQVGETIYPDLWDENRWNECSHGIYFFISRKEAEEY